MANDKKAGAAGAATKDAEAPAVAAPAPDVGELQRTVEALTREIDALRRQGVAPPRVQVEGIFPVPPPPPIPQPVQEVIVQYVDLERALLSPVPPWVFPGSGSGPTIP